MSRSDQYVGLNKYASKYIDSMIKLGALKLDDVKLCDAAFGPDPIMGKQYFYDQPNYFILITEVLQSCVWSSGPVYLTHLKVKFCWKNKNSPKTITDFLKSMTTKIDILNEEAVGTWAIYPDEESYCDYATGYYWP